jgi:hypothetical protein
MLGPTSRYQALSMSPNLFVEPDGRLVRYLPRRFLPPSPHGVRLARVSIGPAERLDQVAARTLGDSEQFWRLCDANDALNPFNQIDEAQHSLRLPAPYDAAQWVSRLGAPGDARQPLLGLPAPGGIHLGGRP